MYAECKTLDNSFLDYEQAEETVLKALEGTTGGAPGGTGKILILPPDGTRIHSKAGDLTASIVKHYGSRVTDIMPALGTHTPMTAAELIRMFPSVPPSLFRIHDWRKDVVTLGEVPGDYIRELSEGKLNFPWPAQINRLAAEGGHDLIISIGQVVPHEVAGMANYTKNIFVGLGGKDSIDKSHFLGAVYGIERILGEPDTPVRRMLDYGYRYFARHLPIVFIHTVIGGNGEGGTGLKGIFVGTEEDCFQNAAALAARENISRLPEPLKKVVVYLNPDEYKSAWLGNKSVYRTRMAIGDGGELIVLAPGIRNFGEDREVDRLIRAYGYCGTETVLRLAASGCALSANLSTAAHLIHGSTEGRFTVTYCTDGLSREEVTGAGYAYAPLKETLARYNPAVLKRGFNTLPDGEQIFYINNPALGLWRLV